MKDFKYYFSVGNGILYTSNNLYWKKRLVDFGAKSIIYYDADGRYMFTGVRKYNGRFKKYFSIYSYVLEGVKK